MPIHTDIALPLDLHEERLVRILGDSIGYGRMMQLAERLWNERLVADGFPDGGAHSAYCCGVFLVPCPACPEEDQSCDWCCGAGRVTERVAQAIKEAT
jgi:hypothetical protein